MLSHPDFKEKNIIIVFSEEKQYFSFRNDNLLVFDREDKIILQSTCHRILALWIVGHCSLSSGLMERSKKFGFPIVLLSFSFRMIGSWNAPTEGNFLLRKKQYAYQDWTIARHLVHNKLENQIATLNSIRKKSIACKEAIAALRKYQQQLPFAQELSDIMGIEGVAARLYFEQWFLRCPGKAEGPEPKQIPSMSYWILDTLICFIWLKTCCIFMASISIRAFIIEIFITENHWSATCKSLLDVL